MLVLVPMPAILMCGTSHSQAFMQAGIWSYKHADSIDRKVASSISL